MSLAFSQSVLNSNSLQTPPGPFPVPADGNWHRALTVACQPIQDPEMAFDVYTAGGTVNIRLTRAAVPGQPHGLLQTDLTQVNKYVPMATINGSGTVNQPQAGAVLSLNVDHHSGSEIGFEFQQVSGTPTVQICGSIKSVS